MVFMPDVDRCQHNLSTSGGMALKQEGEGAVPSMRQAAFHRLMPVVVGTNGVLAQICRNLAGQV